jgi:glyoxylase-like metal-dependent hydrolase (beta-lactamase superfamily II)
MSPQAAASKSIKKAPAAKSKRMTAPKEGVKVRMYRTGLGDCFLLAFPKGTEDSFYLMIDCGVYFRTPEPGNATRIRRIVEDIRDATGGRLDVLAITHEHWDHVSGFHRTQAQEIFAKEIDLGELWMAWTEDRGSPWPASSTKAAPPREPRSPGRSRGCRGSEPRPPRPS